MLRNCFWHSYHEIQQQETSDCHQIITFVSDNHADNKVKKISNDKKRTKKPTLNKLIVDEIMA
jgi:hypothetical protein